MKHKADIRIPTSEQYAYIELHVEEEVEDIALIYSEMTELMAQKEGHSQSDWKRIRERYVNTGEIDPEDVEGANKHQRFFINEIKKVIATNKHEDGI